MDGTALGFVWIPIGIALALLVKEQAKRIAKLEQDHSSGKETYLASIGELRETNTRLQDIHDLEGKILAQVSHELRTPVTAIGFAAKAIQRCSGSEPTKAMEFTSAILRETDRLTSMIDWLLDLVNKDVQEQRAIR